MEMKNNNKNNILILNGGSSSLKFTLYNKKLEILQKGLVEKIGQNKSFIVYNDEIFKFATIKDHLSALKEIYKLLDNDKSVHLEEITDIAHRVVHGGDKYKKTTKITATVKKNIGELSKLAPLHNPISLKIIKAAEKVFKKANHWVIFDTAFYNDLPAKAHVYPLPYAFYEKHKIRRYGFHGISHAYIMEETAKLLKKKPNQINIISCHLGSGASITAIQKGKAIDTSMGFTPLEGLMMSTRCGDIDPAIVLYLQETLKLSPSTINNILNKESGLLGISGHKDMREILCLSGYKIPAYKCLKNASKKEKDQAKLALEMFIYKLAKYIASYSLILEKVDAIILTAGIGERSDIIFDLVKKTIKPILQKNTVFTQLSTNEELMMGRLVNKIRK